MATTRIESIVTGKVWKIDKQKGDTVAQGEAIMVMESMKMEIPIESPVSGRVGEISVAQGDSVNEGEVVAIAAQQQAADAAPSVRRHEDHIAAELLRHADDAPIGRGRNGRRTLTRHAGQRRSRFHLRQFLAGRGFDAMFEDRFLFMAGVARHQEWILLQAHIRCQLGAGGPRELDGCRECLAREFRAVDGEQDVFEHGMAFRLADLKLASGSRDLAQYDVELVLQA
ncbi:allophanate hydrolase [Cupriavidus basilensis OR16]|uniref:Allophanate hydrolase n=1 Tax=Cupriavidus basilensis OR16 TaxID=1127483 RepID=H1S743_9BURK|nr:allophanate hydrolase [Cupriavidus basilensis OR16]